MVNFRHRSYSKNYHLFIHYTDLYSAPSRQLPRCTSNPVKAKNYRCKMTKIGITFWFDWWFSTDLKATCKKKHVIFEHLIPKYEIVLWRCFHAPYLSVCAEPAGSCWERRRIHSWGAHGGVYSDAEKQSNRSIVKIRRQLVPNERVTHFWYKKCMIECKLLVRIIEQIPQIRNFWVKNKIDVHMTVDIECRY